MDIPRGIRIARLSHNLTLEKLESMVDRSKQYMYALEKGEIRLSYEMAVKIVKSMAQLLI